MSKNIFKNELSKLNPYVPGKPVEEVQKEYGLTSVVKLASNENQLGPSPKAVEAVKAELENLNVYPDAGAMELRHELGKKYGLDYENFVVGNGGEQILQIIAQTFINPGDQAIMADPTFGMYGNSVTHMGGIPVKLPLKEHKHDFKAFVENINEKTKIIYVCNPNNPIPNIMPKDEIDYLVKNVPEDIVIVFDEAYYDFAIVNKDYPESLEILKKRPNTVILRTFSKVTGIAGVRVGFAITSKEIAREMSKVKGVFNVNRLAQAAAMGALKDQEHIDKTVKLNYESLALMEKFFDGEGLEYVKSNANFMWANIKTNSKDVFEELLKKGVIIRPGYLWGWDDWIRVSTGTIEQTKIFIDELKKVLK